LKLKMVSSFKFQAPMLWLIGTFQEVL